MKRIKDKFHTWAQMKFESDTAQKHLDSVFAQTNKFHVDICNCSHCQAIEAFNNLPWYGKVVGSLIVG